MGSFERPDPLLQPRQQSAPLGETSEKRLTEVDMALHQTGQDDTATRIERLNPRWTGDLRANLRNPRSANQHFASWNNRQSVVHGDHDPAVNEPGALTPRVRPLVVVSHQAYPPSPM